MNFEEDHLLYLKLLICLLQIDSTFVICKVQYKDDAENSSSDSDSLKKKENKMDSNNQTISIAELPPGFHFRPTDPEVIREFLIKKILNLPIHNTDIKDIDFYDFDPELLPIGEFLLFNDFCLLVF